MSHTDHIKSALALFPIDIVGQSFVVSGHNNGKPLEADGDTAFFSKKKVMALLEQLHGHLTAALTQPADVPTTGAASVSTKGKADAWAPATGVPDSVDEALTDVQMCLVRSDLPGAWEALGAVAKAVAALTQPASQEQAQQPSLTDSPLLMLKSSEAAQLSPSAMEVLKRGAKGMSEYIRDRGRARASLPAVPLLASQQPSGEIRQPQFIGENNAKEAMEKALWDFIDIAAAFPLVAVDERVWPHVMAYTHQQPSGGDVAGGQPADEKTRWIIRHNSDGEFGQATGWLYRDGGHPCSATGKPVFVWRPLQDLLAKTGHALTLAAPKPEPMLNGLTEAETSATASVMGLVASQVDPTREARANEIEQMADQIDRDKYGHGFASAALREYAAIVRGTSTGPGSVPEPVWIVNDLGELGVKVGGRFFFLYKGDSFEYKDGKHDDGTPMRYRIVGKCEFGETCWPLSWVKAGRREDRYTVNLNYIPGLSWGKPEDGEWRDLSPTPLATRP